MNRRARYALIAPLLVTALAAPPALAAAAAPVQGQPAALAAPLQPSCKLVAAPGTNPLEFDLVLTGFGPRQNVNISGPERFTRTVSQQGAFTEQDVAKGTYTASVGQNRNRVSVACEKPARVPVTTPVDISDADVTPANPGAVNCANPTPISFQGTLSGTGAGTVKYQWEERGGSGKISQPTVDFKAPSTKTVSFTVTAPPRAAANAPAPTVTVQLSVPKQAGETGVKSGDVKFTLTCQ
ncbi:MULTISPECIES: hypothetical protein [unclassified Streptomyces]|uniref:hypothetical protein n=1 Tax=unclassified Streptomyces TaxID=2593676 RepID=UPI0029A671E3|nr:hypothetical protein [Streptomyces sp. DK15]MDX2391854.1 hypothetical protein [Streptomyces sp. DK15]